MGAIAAATARRFRRGLVGGLPQRHERRVRCRPAALPAVLVFVLGFGLPVVVSAQPSSSASGSDSSGTTATSTEIGNGTGSATATSGSSAASGASAGSGGSTSGSSGSTAGSGGSTAGSGGSTAGSSAGSDAAGSGAASTAAGAVGNAAVPTAGTGSAATGGASAGAAQATSGSAVGSAATGTSAPRAGGSSASQNGSGGSSAPTASQSAGAVRAQPPAQNRSGSPAQSTASSAGGNTGSLPTSYVTAATDIPVDLSSDQVPVGDQITLSFVVRSVDAENSVVVEPSYPNIVSRTDGPVIRTTFAGDPSGRTQVKAAEVQITFTGVTAGRAIVPAIMLQEGHNAYYTEPVVVAVSNPKTGAVPPSVEWTVSPSTPYQGQIEYVQLEVFNMTAPSFPDSVAVTPPAGGVFEEVHGLGKIRTTTVGGTQLFRFPAATYFLTPTAEGSVTLPPASVTVGGETSRSAPLTVSAIPLPPTVQKSGAVGDFSFTANLDRKQLAEGETLSLVLRLEGVGNLDYFKFPEVSGGSLVVTGTQEQSKYVATELGYTGYREETVTLSPRSSGTTNVHVGSFSWVDPQTGRVTTTAAQDFPVTVNPAPISAPNAAKRGSSAFTLLSADQIRESTPANAYQNPLSYLWFIPGILLLIARFIFRRKLALLPFFGALILLVSVSGQGQFPIADIQAANASFAAGDIAAALKSFDSALDKAPNNPGILYNEALCYFQEHEDGQALYRAFAAVRLGPTNSTFRSALNWMESQLNLDRQVEPPPGVHPDLLLVLTLILFNATCAVAALIGRRRTGIFFISVALLSVLTLGAASATAVMAHLRNTEIGVVGPDTGNLVKIPRDNATSWLKLPPGTSVRVRLRANGFYLIQTGFGVEGWLPVGEVEYGDLSSGEGT